MNIGALIEGSNVAVTGGKQRYNERNSDGRFKRKFINAWDGTHWDEGFLHKRGYFMVYRPDHPKANAMGMVRRHHVVWWLATGEVIQQGEALHHKNKIKTEDHLENLEKVSHGEHTRLHSSKPQIECKCRACGRTFYVPRWRITQGRGKVCSQECWQQYKCGVNHPNAKLRPADVERIRSSTAIGAVLARELNIGPTMVSRVRRRKAYV